MSSTIQQQISEALSTVDARGTRGRRLLDQASRLRDRVHQLLALELVPAPVDVEALDLACSALQLTLRDAGGAGGGTARQPMTLKDRVESAGELLISLAQGDTVVLDRTVRLLRQMPQRLPIVPEARVLADAVNLEDFGVTGLMGMMASVALAGDGVTQLAEACATREQYGYWDARLARFHFPAVREIARQRLENGRRALEMLRSELPGAA